MNQVRLSLLVVWYFGSAAAAQAAPPSEQTRACVAASTQGQTDRDEGRLLAAREQLLMCARDACPSIVKKSCGAWLTELSERIPSVVVRVHDAQRGDVPDARVTLDGEPLTLDGRPVSLDPGTHVLSVDLRQEKALERTFLVAEREQGRLLIIELPARSAQQSEPAQSELQPATPRAGVLPSRSATPALTARPTGARSSPVPARFRLPVAAFVLGGVGVAGLTSFAVLRNKAERDLAALLRECSPECSVHQRDAGKRTALAADISLGIGIAALAGAGAWMFGSWFAQRSEATSTRRTAKLVLVPGRGGAVAGIAAPFF